MSHDTSLCGVFKKHGHLVARLGCAATTSRSWDDLAFQTYYSRVESEALNFAIVDPWDDEFILFGAFSDEIILVLRSHPNGYGNNESQNILGMDIAKITRKQSKPDKHAHGNG
ncbi:hypothetical protein Tco_0296016 [Tanacetum coccineum]